MRATATSRVSGDESRRRPRWRRMRRRTSRWASARDDDDVAGDVEDGNFERRSNLPTLERELRKEIAGAKMQMLEISPLQRLQKKRRLATEVGTVPPFATPLPLLQRRRSWPSRDFETARENRGQTRDDEAKRLEDERRRRRSRKVSWKRKLESVWEVR